MRCRTSCVATRASAASDPDAPIAEPLPTRDRRRHVAAGAIPPKDTPMAINIDELRARPLDPEIDEEITRFEDAVAEYLAGDLDEDVFRVIRLTQGIYGQ